MVLRYPRFVQGIYFRDFSIVGKRKEREKERTHARFFFFFQLLEFNFVAGDWGAKGGPAYNIAPCFPLFFFAVSPSRRVQFPLAVSKYFPVISEMAVARKDFTRVSRIATKNSLFSTRRREISPLKNNRMERTRKCSGLEIKERCPRNTNTRTEGKEDRICCCSIVDWNEESIETLNRNEKQRLSITRFVNME